MASQALPVVLAPTIVEVGLEFGVQVGAVGQARSVLAGAAIATSFGIAPFLDRLGVRPLLRSSPSRAAPARRSPPPSRSSSPSTS
jgi:predicted MFS family arabinose efflux permease